MSLLPSEFDLAQDQLSALGCVAIEAARIDSLLERIIWMICEFQGDTGRRHTERLDTGAKLHLLGTLTLARLGEERAREGFQRIADEIVHALARKNALFEKTLRHRSHRSPASQPEACNPQQPRSMRAANAMIVARRLFRLHDDLWNFYRLHATDFLSLPSRIA